MSLQKKKTSNKYAEKKSKKPADRKTYGASRRRGAKGENIKLNKETEVKDKKTDVSKKTKNKNGIKKEYLKSRDICKVTFSLPKVATNNAKTVRIVGDFNDWNIHESPMKKLKNGNFTITLELKPGMEYQFRYLIDEVELENDWYADKYVRNPYGDSDNSVVIL